MPCSCGTIAVPSSLPAIPGAPTVVSLVALTAACCRQDKTAYTGLESHIASRIAQRALDYFPINRAGVTRSLHDRND